jgi:hypothetical protein
MTKEQIEKAQALLLRHSFGEHFLHIDVRALLQQIVADGAAAGYKTKVARMPSFNESK